MLRDEYFLRSWKSKRFFLPFLMKELKINFMIAFMKHFKITLFHTIENSRSWPQKFRFVCEFFFCIFSNYCSRVSTVPLNQAWWIFLSTSCAALQSKHQQHTARWTEKLFLVIGCRATFTAVYIVDPASVPWERNFRPVPSCYVISIACGLKHK